MGLTLLVGDQLLQLGAPAGPQPLPAVRQRHARRQQHHCVQRRHDDAAVDQLVSHREGKVQRTCRHPHGQEALSAKGSTKKITPQAESRRKRRGRSIGQLLQDSISIAPAQRLRHTQAAETARALQQAHLLPQLLELDQHYAVLLAQLLVLVGLRDCLLEGLPQLPRLLLRLLQLPRQHQPAHACRAQLLLQTVLHLGATSQLALQLRLALGLALPQLLAQADFFLPCAVELPAQRRLLILREMAVLQLFDVPQQRFSLCFLLLPFGPVFFKSFLKPFDFLPAAARLFLHSSPPFAFFCQRHLRLPQLPCQLLTLFPLQLQLLHQPLAFLGLAIDPSCERHLHRDGGSLERWLAEVNHILAGLHF